MEKNIILCEETVDELFTKCVSTQDSKKIKAVKILNGAKDNNEITTVYFDDEKLKEYKEQENQQLKEF